MAKRRWLLVLVLLGAIWLVAGCGLSASDWPGRIAFVTTLKSAGGHWVVVASRPSFDVLALGELGRSVSIGTHDMAWSHTGRFVYFEGADHDPVTWLSVIDADGKNQRRVLNVEERPPSSVSISPDGARIVITRADSRVVESPFLGSTRQDTIRFGTIESIDIASGAVRLVLSADNMSIDRAVFSSDGRRIAFVGRTDDPHTFQNIYVVNADGSDMRRLTDLTIELNRFEPPRWSPDGRQILYGAETLFLSDIDHYDDLFVVDVASARTTNLTNSPGTDDAEYCWSPDGRQIAFTSSQPEDVWGVYVMDADGSDRREVVEHAGEPSWLPDGQRLLSSGRAYDSATERWVGSGILETDIKTGETKTVIPVQDRYYTLMYPLWVGR